MQNPSIERLTNLSAILLGHPTDSKRRDFSLTQRKIENVYDYYYGHEHIKVTFFPRNAAPLLQETNKPAYIFMPCQPWVRQKRWENFAASTRANTVVIQEDSPSPHSLNPDSNDLLYICGYPTSLVAAAVALSPENIHLRNLLESFQKPLKPPTYAEFIDFVMAGKFIDKEGNLKEAPDFEGEALMLNGLIGNQQSALELIKRKAILEQMAPIENSSKFFTTDDAVKSSSRLEDFVMVHATNYLPYANSGKVYIRTRFDGSNEEEARTSVHFSLNHHVISHKQGHWEEQSNVLIGSAEGIVNLNGEPYSFRPEDTYYLLSPGNAVALPTSAVMVCPKEELQAAGIPLQKIAYASKRFSTEELAEIAAEWNTIFGSQSRIKDVQRWVFDRSYHPNGPSWTGFTMPSAFNSLQECVQARLRGSQKTESWQPAEPITIQALRTKFVKLSTLLSKSLKKFSLRRNQDALDVFLWSQVPSVISKDNLVSNYGSIRKDLQGCLAYAHKMITVNHVIQQMGCKIRYVDPDYLETEDFGNGKTQPPSDIAEVLEFAQRIGFSIIRNPKTAEGNLDQCLFAMKKALAPTEEREHLNPYEERDHIKALQNIARKHFLESTPQMRRMIYLTGGYQIGDYYF